MTSGGKALWEPIQTEPGPSSQETRQPDGFLSVAAIERWGAARYPKLITTTSTLSGLSVVSGTMTSDGII